MPIKASKATAGARSTRRKGTSNRKANLQRISAKVMSLNDAKSRRGLKLKISELCWELHSLDKTRQWPWICY